MKANKWMSMALAMALTAGSGVSAYAAEVDTPADSSVPAEQQSAEDTPTVEIVEGMIEQLEQEIADDENDILGTFHCRRNSDSGKYRGCGSSRW